MSSYTSLFKRLLPIGGVRSLKVREIEKTLGKNVAISETSEDDLKEEKKKEKDQNLNEIELETDSQNENENENQNENQNENEKPEKKSEDKNRFQLTETEIRLILRRSTRRYGTQNILGAFSQIQNDEKEEKRRRKRRKRRKKSKLLASFWLWVVLVALLILFCTKLFRSACLSIQLYRQQIIGDLQQGSCFNDRPDISDYPETVSVYAIQLINQFSDYCPIDQKPLENSFKNFMYRFSRYQVNKIMNAISVVTGISAFIAFIILLLLWRSIFNLYRKRIMLLRQGKKPFNDFDQAKTVLVTSYTNLQIWLGLISFLVVWIIVFIILFLIPALYWFVSKDFVVKVITVIIIFLAIVFVYQIIFGIVIQKIMNKYFVDKEQITNRTAFSIYDFIKFFMTVFSGATSAVKKLLGTTGGSVSTIFRLDDEKSIDESYSAMMLIDHQTNNPILRVFANYLMNLLKHQKQMIRHITEKKPDISEKEISMAVSYLENHPITGEPFEIEKIRKKYLFLLTIAANKKIQELRKNVIETERKRKEFLKQKEDKIWETIKNAKDLN
ncbi:hypothetical protein M0811_10960 [Anaeramoeba ignava]|uniref:Transmembrane protein n=1 Tax=Anaeramoeba ignava TaxID=1746090 RepID=A0A9Q0LD16_ANAIG|nr:hypothetical protein M0811_10960 [Anaeramoeba ignava]